jgi:spermidine synthase
MARRDFTYLRDSRATVDVRIGDGRQLLAGVPDDRFDLLMIDAFTSDAIPMHLLTDEALALYLRKLKPSGLLVMHISNRYADLSRVFRGWSEATGHRVAIDQFVPDASEDSAGVLATVAVAISRAPAALAPLAATRQWFWLDADGPAVRWTDDRANLLSVIDRNVLRP